MPNIPKKVQSQKVVHFFLSLTTLTYFDITIPLSKYPAVPVDYKLSNCAGEGDGLTKNADGVHIFAPQDNGPVLGVLRF